MNPALGIGLKVASTLFFTMMLVCVKLVAGKVPPGEIVFARSFFALLPIIAMLGWQREIVTALRTSRPWLHVSRGAVGVSSMAMGFIAVGMIPLPEAMTISYAAPLMIVVLAALVLGETVRLFRWSAVAIGFVGIVVVFWPNLTLLRSGELTHVALVGSLVALTAAFLSAFAAIFVRRMTQSETVGSIVFYFAVTASLLSLGTVPFGWIVPDLATAALLVLTGLLGGVGQILMTNAYRYAGAATIAPFEYVSLLWGLAFGWVIFSEVPGTSVIAGGAIVIGAGIFIIFREHRLGLERARQRRAMTPQG
jgi:drug/metabolite transporter (DMT)-like permease